MPGTLLRDNMVIRNLSSETLVSDGMFPIINLVDKGTMCYTTDIQPSVDR